MKLVTIVGARPQFIKAAAVSGRLRTKATEILVHTGQHYDLQMSEVFFQELGIPAPDYHLGIGSGSHGAQTGKMLEEIEQVLMRESPELVLVYGDTNSTLAGALAAAKLHIPIAHVEAGLRSFNRQMPEEINRVLTDHLSTWLLAPTPTAVAHLQNEGIQTGVQLVGDVMYDIFLQLAQVAPLRSDILQRENLAPRDYYLLTLHRAENTDDPQRLRVIMETLQASGLPIVFPIHPRTKKQLAAAGITLKSKQFKLLEPVGYFEMLNLELNATAILTDSGGVQKEAYFAGVPCITLREETEWVETVTAAWNRLVGAAPERLQSALKLDWVGKTRPELFGNGSAAAQITEILSRK